MRRKVLLVVLAAGTVLGYASAFRSHHHRERHRAWKAEVADLCVSAAERRWNDKASVKP
ncbi:MAG TPA: hypothetical protein VFU02_06485 [Polyangiaceae bacterium]|nr:hypothetical protein [Polyangiaceae bacterium]